jgi:hypothetical protein
VKLRVCQPAIVSLLLAASTLSAEGAIISVTTLEQKISDHGGCSLQEAIYSANLHANVAFNGYTANNP